MAVDRLQADLFSQLREPFTGESLFDGLVDLTYFIKNGQGQYVVVNQTLVERCGFRRKSELLGKTADQVYRPPLGQSYRAQDEAILRTGAPILNRLELQIHASGETGWCLTNKTPLRGRRGEVVGLVGVSRDLQTPNEKSRDYSPVAEVVDHIQTHFGEPLKVRQLAARAGLSLYQFEERIRRLFQITAGQFIQKVRMEAAVERLRETDRPIAKIALDCGYSDQSAFTRQFRQAIGLSPSRYRRVSKG